MLTGTSQASIPLTPRLFWAGLPKLNTFVSFLEAFLPKRCIARTLVEVRKVAFFFFISSFFHFFLKT
jgi:hypothetical protein